MGSRYLFLCAYKMDIDGSDDLFPAFKRGNEEVFAVEIRNCPNEEMAYIIGKSRAWDADMPEDRTFHTVELILNRHTFDVPDYEILLWVDGDDEEKMGVVEIRRDEVETVFYPEDR